MRFLSFLLAVFTYLAYSQDSYSGGNPQRRIYGGLILPQVRVNTAFSSVTTEICGGTARDKIHFITSQNVDIEFRWYIETPVQDGTCIFRVSESANQNDESTYVALPPQDRNDVAADGSFPCGRTAGSENSYFVIPQEIDCDLCILEWIWTGPDFSVRQCADITVIGGDDINCLGRCENGGVCQKGVCVCPTGYSGTYCETAPGAVGRAARNILAIIFFILLAIILILLIIMLLYWCAKKKITEGEKDQIYHTNKPQKYLEFDVELPQQPHGVDKPAELIRRESQSEY